MSPGGPARLQEVQAKDRVNRFSDRSTFSRHWRKEISMKKQKEARFMVQVTVILVVLHAMTLLW